MLREPSLTKVPLLRIIMSAIGAEPDMRHYLALVDGGAPDRKPTNCAQCGHETSRGILRQVSAGLGA